jgi:hypothetical protein
LRPGRAGRDIGDANYSPQEINRVKVLAYIAALDRALDEGAKRFMDLSVGRLEHLLGIADERIQYRAMICFVSTASTNSNNQPRKASTGGKVSASVRSAAASFSTSDRRAAPIRQI